jgi:hypothetical protein
MTTLRLTLPSSPTSFLRNNKWLSSPTHRTPLIWHPVTSISKNEIDAEMTPVWYHWGDPARIAESAWHSHRKGLPGSVPEIEETVGPVSTCGKELLGGWWWSIGLMMIFMIFTASVRNILDITTYTACREVYLNYYGTVCKEIKFCGAHDVFQHIKHDSIKSFMQYKVILLPLISVCFLTSRDQARHVMTNWLPSSHV